jgi:3-phenylpropionate/trans-cinnamate dioxygenase ferredoxin reductase subunit
MEPTYVIIGAGLAGSTAAAALRTEGFAGRIVLVGDEVHLPYSKPPLSKDLLRGESGPEKTLLRLDEWYTDNAVDLELGVAATAIDASSRRVELADGRRLDYDKVLIATGGSPRTLDLPGSTLDGVHTVRTLEDSADIHARLAAGGPIVIVGAGFIGLEVAASARMMGVDTTVLEILPTPLVRVLGPTIGAIYADLHRERGVDLRTETGIAAIEGSGEVERVVTSDGRTLDANVVVVGIGLAPELRLAESAGLLIDNGIVVDEHCRTSVPDIYAVGDLANHPNPILGRRFRLEHWQNAQHQATSAARNMAGRDDVFSEVPWFWSDQYEFNLQMAGMPDPTDRTVIRGSVEARDFSVWFVRDGVLTATVGVGRPLEVRAARVMIRKGITLPDDVITDESVDLQELSKR